MFFIDIKHKDVGLTSYKIRTKEEASNEGINFKHWKDADEGDYAVSDDGYIGKVIKRKQYHSSNTGVRNYIRMPWGYIFYSPIRDKQAFNAKGRQSVHTLSGKREIEVKVKKQKMKDAALFYAIQPDSEVVIKTVYGDINSAKKRTIKRWMRSEVFKTMVKEERIKLLKDNAFGEEDVVTMLKKAITMAEDKKDVSNYMRCVENIQDMLGMRDKDKIVETTQIEATSTRKIIDEIAEEEKKLIATNQKVIDE
tara:strand:- start:5417 stop:6172 length:756 start_codon:yes stop_codon:yes gene_type:complete